MQSRYEVPFLDYYGAHQISPVSQEISDLKKHFDRREALFKHCGIPPGMVAGKSVLEVGPGTGHNALYTHSLGPMRYLLVDGNPTSVAETTQRLEEYYPNDTAFEVALSTWESFETDEQFDLVICEGVIANQLEPIKFLKKLASFVKPSGMLLVSCMDSVSYLPERLRSAMCHITLHGKTLSEKEKVEYLLPFAIRSVKHLPGMSRPPEDWIYDNLLQPMIGKLFSIEDAIVSLQDDFQVFGTSPQFIQDWRWYKDIYGDNKSNGVSLTGFLLQLHNLLDFREILPPREIDQNRKLQQLTNACVDLTVEIVKKPGEVSLIQALQLELERLLSDVESFSPITANAIREFERALHAYLVEGQFPKELPHFESWFGRGQQYISLLKNR